MPERNGQAAPILTILSLVSLSLFISRFPAVQLCHLRPDLLNFRDGVHLESRSFIRSAYI